MASFDFCIDQSLKAGRITKDVAERLKNSDDVDTELTNIVANLNRQKRETVIQTVKMAENWNKASSWQGKSILGRYHKSQDPLKGINALLARDAQGVAKYINVDLLATGYKSQYHAAFADAMQHFRTRALGWYQNKEDLTKLIKSIYGETVDDPKIMKFANDWHKLNERMRTEFNAKGGSINKNDKWLLPQNHDARAILSLGKNAKLGKVDLEKAKAAWIKEITPFLDFDQMVDDLGKPLSKQQIDEALDYTFETIVTNGANKTQDFSVPRLGKKLSRRHSERRFLYFKDADSWIKYQEKFGRGDIFSALTGHIDAMAHETALMEVLGPNPESMYKSLVAQAEKQMKGISPSRKAYSQALFNVVSGKVNGGEMLTLADASNTVTNMLVASTLGHAFLSALSDVGFHGITSAYRGLPVMRGFGKQIRLMKDEQLQVFAAKIGLTADGMIGRLHAANRHADVYGVGASSKIAEGVMRASLLEPWTNAGRWAWGLNFSQELAQNFGKSFDELSNAFKRGFDEYGITPDDWDALRKTKAMEMRGAKYADLSKPEARKFAIMVNGEADFAIPTPDARVRAITTGGLERASIKGQSWRAAMMLKSFPIGVIMTHFMRGAYQSTTAGKMAYLGAMVGTTTVLGGLALQMKDIAKGRDPREMFDDEGIPLVDDEFAMAAFMQGGGLGLFGDLVFSDYTRFGQTFSQAMLGPKVGFIDDTFKTLQLSAGGLQDAVASGQTNVLGDLVQYADRYTPDIWQTHLFMNAAFDWLEMQADPKAAKKFNRQTRKRRKEFDQEYWWAPGKLVPDRAPDLGAAFGE